MKPGEWYSELHKSTKYWLATEFPGLAESDIDSAMQQAAFEMLKGEKGIRDDDQFRSAFRTRCYQRCLDIVNRSSDQGTRSLIDSIDVPVASRQDDFERRRRQIPVIYTAIKTVSSELEDEKRWLDRELFERDFDIGFGPLWKGAIPQSVRTLASLRKRCISVLAEFATGWKK